MSIVVTAVFSSAIFVQNSKHVDYKKGEGLRTAFDQYVVVGRSIPILATKAGRKDGAPRPGMDGGFERTKKADLCEHERGLVFVFVGGENDSELALTAPVLDASDRLGH